MRLPITLALSCKAEFNASINLRLDVTAPAISNQGARKIFTRLNNFGKMRITDEFHLVTNKGIALPKNRVG